MAKMLIGEAATMRCVQLTNSGNTWRPRFNELGYALVLLPFPRLPAGASSRSGIRPPPQKGMLPDREKRHLTH